MKLRLNGGQQAKSSLTIDGKKLLGVNAINKMYQLNRAIGFKNVLLI
jgi:hypothetical protein